MITVSLLNRKGGAGKTTASVNLAAIFAKKYNKKVLLVDFDPQANASMYLDKFVSKDEKSIYDVICENMEISKIIIDTDIENLKLAPANIHLDKADTMLSSVMVAREFRLQSKLSEVADQFDYVFIDCPPTRNNVTVNALVASDFAILPCEATEYGLDSMSAMRDFVVSITEHLNQNLEVAGVLFTKKENNTPQNFYCEQMKQLLTEYHFFKTNIRKTVVVDKSLNWHQPLIVYNEAEKVTQDYLCVAEELYEIINGGNCNG